MLFGIKDYQKQLLSYFLNQDLPKLKELAKKIPSKHGLLTYLVQDMVLTLEGSPVKNEDRSYKILKGIDKFNDALLWCVLVSVKIYKNKNWNMVVDKVLDIKNIYKISQKTKVLLIQIATECLFNTEDTFTRDAANELLQKLSIVEKE
ncbi:hypothetical protein FP435_03095 [Lactobacillus sp. PV037]|uniref:hypothetical protein n=1 Tax=Lactobacillus sp. PV037 TaxID=2594496 RepID=UPI00223FBD34|nr:hypothetical protein [Lactobacillus sp. PV037]QNQ83498.1 hypothetical protein FP435_03095 [Lactobacillus sp. PV037]